VIRVAVHIRRAAGILELIYDASKEHHAESIVRFVL
jgi:hypothetical protein